MNSPDSEFQRISPQKRRCNRGEFWFHAKSPKRESMGWNALGVQPSDIRNVENDSRINDCTSAATEMKTQAVFRDQWACG
jgi:hypothetical protein